MEFLQAKGFPVLKIIPQRFPSPAETTNNINS